MTVDTIAYKAHSKNLIASTTLFIWLILIFMLSGHAMAENNSVPGTLYQFSNPPGYGAVHDDNITSNIYNPAPGASTDGLPSFVDLTEHNWFPKIRSQKGGSCVAWSTTYYPFTYQVARLNDWDAKHDDSKVF